MWSSHQGLNPFCALQSLDLLRNCERLYSSLQLWIHNLFSRSRTRGLGPELYYEKWDKVWYLECRLERAGERKIYYPFNRDFQVEVHQAWADMYVRWRWCKQCTKSVDSSLRLDLENQMEMLSPSAYLFAFGFVNTDSEYEYQYLLCAKWRRVFALIYS